MRFYIIFAVLLLAIYPSMYYGAEYFQKKGEDLLNQKKYEHAIQAFDWAIKLKARPDALAYYKKGIALNRLGKHQDALESCKKAIEYKADAAEVYGGEDPELKAELELNILKDKALNIIGVKK